MRSTITCRYLVKTYEGDSCGVLYVTHAPGLAAEANRVIAMQDGTVMADKAGEPV